MGGGVTTFQAGDYGKAEVEEHGERDLIAKKQKKKHKSLQIWYCDVESEITSR